MLRKRLSILAFAFTAVVGLILAGCSRTSSQPAAVVSATQPVVEDDHEHAHKTGGHGGAIIAVGRDSYHAEAVFEKGGAVRLFLFGKDETRVQEVDVQDMTAHVRAEGVAEALPLRFRADPQANDSAGKTSQFVAALPAELVGKSVEVVIPGLRVGGERFRVAFTSTASAPHDDDRPVKVTDAAETTLYLTPGGKYTAADIEANGRQTASQKFDGRMAAHNMKPQPGDKVCPITQTKANAKFGWVVDGKMYEFCCPPCVDEFVQKAKEHPEEIGDPSDYIKK
jgi:YHS domain-containing protein